MKTFSLQYTVINDKYLEVLDSIQPWCGFLKQGGLRLKSEEHMEFARRKGEGYDCKQKY